MIVQEKHSVSSKRQRQMTKGSHEHQPICSLYSKSLYTFKYVYLNCKSALSYIKSYSYAINLFNQAHFSLVKKVYVFSYRECSIHPVSFKRHHHFNSRAVDKQAGELLRQYSQTSYMIWKCHVSVHNNSHCHKN